MVKLLVWWSYRLASDPRLQTLGMKRPTAVVLFIGSGVFESGWIAMEHFLYLPIIKQPPLDNALGHLCSQAIIKFPYDPSASPGPTPGTVTWLYNSILLVEIICDIGADDAPIGDFLGSRNELEKLLIDVVNFTPVILVGGGLITAIFVDLVENTLDADVFDSRRSVLFDTLDFFESSPVQGNFPWSLGSDL
nr:hypothetical protein HmN_000665600 [Hymenolepis microstoma]